MLRQWQTRPRASSERCYPLNLDDSLFHESPLRLPIPLTFEPKNLPDMKRLTTRSFLSALLFLLVGALIGAQIQASLSSNDAIEQFKKMKRAFVLISGKYLNQVDPKRLAKGGVEGMLDRLDPHSSYLPPNEVSRKRGRIRGSFGGVGIRFDVLNDTARVVSPIAGGPSEEAGVRAGDRIVQIEDSTAIGLPERSLRNRLTGQKGTEVNFTIYRPLSGERITFTIKRGEIPLYSINSAYMIDDQTGYLRIGRFAQSTHDEFLEKAGELKNKGMERLIIDLQENGGGAVESAIKIADEMLGRSGRPIVKMKGRISRANQTWRTQSGGLLEDEPVTVLVNGNTASSSEILAGALQDHDRALLVGRRTFGKGLVQKPFSLNDGSLLNLTIGAYYTPVGRFIQTPYENGDQESYYEKKHNSRREAIYDVRQYKDNIPDSLTYRTEHGRVVFGGGGILPDYVVKPDTTSLRGVLRRSEFDRFFKFFASEWYSMNGEKLQSTWRNREEEFLSSYQVPESAVSRFWSYAQEKGILTLTTDSDSVEPSQHVFPKAKTRAVDDLVRTHVKGHLANVMFGEKAGQPVLNEVDQTVQKSLSLWPSSRELASYHTSTPSARDDQ